MTHLILMTGFCCQALRPIAFDEVYQKAKPSLSKERAVTCVCMCDEVAVGTEPFAMGQNK